MQLPSDLKPTRADVGELIVEQFGDVVSVYGCIKYDQNLRLFHGVTNPRTGMSPVALRWIFSEYLALSAMMTWGSTSSLRSPRSSNYIRNEDRKNANRPNGVHMVR